MSIDAIPPQRQNRTVVLHLGNTETEYHALIATPEGMLELIRRVEIADSLNWGHLADGHDQGCARHLHFTHHQTHQGEYESIAPTGKTVTSTGITIIRIVDGKVVEDRFESGGPTLKEQLA